MKSKLMVALLLGVVLFTSAAFINPFKPKEKFAIILHADKGTHEGLGRAAHALLYARELREKNYTVKLIFDGAGTTWVEELTKPESKSPLLPDYREVKKLGVIEVICDFCANAFDVKKALEARKHPLCSEYQGHPSISKLIKQGYTILIL